LDLFFSFIIGFTVTWILTKSEILDKPQIVCCLKDTVIKLAEKNKHNSTIKKKLKEFSFIKIQNGNYEYEEVLTVLKKKE
jgi:hypothetical protein